MKTLQPACKKQQTIGHQAFKFESVYLLIFTPSLESYESHTVHCSVLYVVGQTSFFFTSLTKNSYIFSDLHYKNGLFKTCLGHKLCKTEISVSSYFKTETYMSHGVWQVKPVFSALLRRANMLKKIIYFKGREQASLDLQAKLMISLGQ